MDDEKDYLTVDEEIYGQNFCCLSFVEPTNMNLMEDKEAYMCTNFLQDYILNYKSKIQYQQEKIKELEDEEIIVEEQSEKIVEIEEKKETGPVAEEVDDKEERLKKLKEKHEEELADLLDYNNLKSNYKDFKIVNFNKLSKSFEKDSPKNREVTVRGVKVRGSFRTLKQAQEHADSLQKIDQMHHVFVGQVGYWLPFNPVDIDSIKKQEYLNKELNELVREKHEQADKRNQIFSDRKDKLSSK